MRRSAAWSMARWCRTRPSRICSSGRLTWFATSPPSFTGVQGKDGGDVANQVNRPEEQIRDGRVLHHLAIDQAADLRIGSNLVRRHQVRAERRSGLEGLALQPLRGADRKSVV